MAETDACAQMTCLYCNRPKAAADFSLEHILPDRLGGALCGNIFKTRSVCRDCNSVVGTFVDGAFIKNWFRTNDEATAARQYLDLKAPNSTMPLAYVGALDSRSLPDDEICEFWLGPCGENFYHVHRRDDRRWDTYAGGNPIARKADPGRVYLFLCSPNKDWARLALRSMKLYFPRAKRYAGNFSINQDDPATTFIHAADSIAQAEIARLRRLDPTDTGARVAIDVGFDYRFAAKLALGLGYTILGKDFLDTEYSRDLRAALWSRDSTSRENIHMRGKGYFSSTNDPVTRVMARPGAYAIHLHAMRDHLTLSLYLPSTHSLCAVISDTPALWTSERFASYREGQVFLLIPQLDQFVGPLPLGSYISHRLGNAKVGKLSALEAMRIDPASLPPCIDGEPTSRTQAPKCHNPPNPHLKG
jgi:hypothetical protein